MSVPMVLLPVFVLIGLTFALLLWMAFARRGALVGGQTKIRDIVLGQPNWPVRATQIGNCFKNQFELPVLFYILIAIALPLRREADYDYIYEYACHEGNIGLKGILAGARADDAKAAAGK